MGDLTANLSVWEFACKCKYPDCNGKRVAHMPLVLTLQKACDYFLKYYDAKKVSIEISGPNRCAKHNADEGGAPNSTHVDYIAADIKIKVLLADKWYPVPPETMYEYFDKTYPNSYGVGLYDNRIHVDTRSERARW